MKNEYSSKAAVAAALVMGALLPMLRAVIRYIGDFYRYYCIHRVQSWLATNTRPLTRAISVPVPSDGGEESSKVDFHIGLKTAHSPLRKKRSPFSAIIGNESSANPGSVALMRTWRRRNGGFRYFVIGNHRVLRSTGRRFASENLTMNGSVAAAKQTLTSKLG